MTERALRTVSSPYLNTREPDSGETSWQTLHQERWEGKKSLVKR